MESLPTGNEPALNFLIRVSVEQKHGSHDLMKNRSHLLCEQKPRQLTVGRAKQSYSLDWLTIASVGLMKIPIIATEPRFRYGFAL